jgi:hypothetical protein
MLDDASGSYQPRRHGRFFDQKQQRQTEPVLILRPVDDKAGLASCFSTAKLSRRTHWSLRTAPPVGLHIIQNGLDELDDFFGTLFVAPAVTIQELGANGLDELQKSRH